MPNKKSNSRERDENGKFVTAKAVVSKLGVSDENPVSAKKGDVKTRHGSTITTNQVTILWHKHKSQ